MGVGVVGVGGVGTTTYELAGLTIFNNFETTEDDEWHQSSLLFMRDGKASVTLFVTVRKKTKFCPIALTFAASMLFPLQ